MTKVYITDYITNPDIEKKILGKDLTTKVHSNVSILLVWHQIINKKYINKFPNLQAVIRYGVGYDNIDLVELKKRKIIFCNTPDYGVDEVSDTSIAMILNAVRGINEYNICAKHYVNSWQENIIKSIKRISDLNLGVIGAGRIGSSVLLKAKALNFKTFFYDPYKECGYEKTLNSKRFDNLDNLLKKCHIISIHTPLTNETKGLVNKNFIKKLKKNCIFINTARGEIVENLDHLYNGLISKKLSFVALDVLPEETLPIKSSKLINAWKKNDKFSGKIIINPHTSYYSKKAFIEMRKKTAQNALRILKKLKPKNIINYE